MLVRSTYCLVIFIWATTPLAIKLGGDSLAPFTSLGLRILLAFSLGSVISTVLGWGGLALRAHWKLYFAASISLFPNMACVYWAAEYLPSGLISLLFAMAPFFTLLLAGPILGEAVFHPRKLLSLLLAFSGLAWLLFSSQGMPVQPMAGQDQTGQTLANNHLIGFALMIASNITFSVSALWVKRLNASLNVPPVEQTLGAMAFSLPGLLLCWYFSADGQLPVFSPVSLASLLYLALCGSLLGFVAYYFILGKMPVERVSLIPLITPVMAISLGRVVASEPITPGMLIGAALILLGLALHQNLLRLPVRLGQA